MKRCQVVVLFLAAVLFVSSCQSKNSSGENNQPPKTADNIEGNLLSVANTTQTDNQIKPPAPQKIEFDSVDGARIVGSFYAASKPNAPAVLMLHQWGSNRASFDALAKQFQADNIAVLAIDGRGFGESVKKIDGSTILPERTDQAVAGMKLDVSAAIKWFGQQQNVDHNRIGIIGASYGSSLAIIYAAADSNIKAVALLSPGLNYFGNLAIEPAVKSFAARPVLFVAAADDPESADAARHLDSAATGDKHQLKIYSRGGHGTALLSAGVGLDKMLADFFRDNL